MGLAETIVPFHSRHGPGFRSLVVATLTEFGFQEDPLIDRDLQDPPGHYDAVWIAEEDGRVIGSVAMRLLAPNEAELKRMYLTPDRRGRGLGRRLLELALDWAQERDVSTVRLDTAQEMKAAQGLYESVGFTRTGTRTEVGERDSRCEILYALDLRERARHPRSN
jgi:ribosomal protein S18 acetylase RimI-like enzyme